MLYALDEIGNRIKPLKNGKGICPICKHKVQAVCGAINIHHWRHEPNPNCDSWYEHETEWHRQWKKVFPEDWQEVVIIKNDEIHRADIKTKTGLVLELQNSSILADIIEERELFYEKMAWLINAERFKDNFKIKSIVNSKLREIEAYYYNFHIDVTILLEINDEIENINLKKVSIEKTINEKEKILKIYTEKLNKIDDVFNSLITSSCYDLYDFTSRDSLINQISINKQKQVDIKKKIKNYQNQISYIQSLKRCPIKEYSDFFMISFDKVNQTSFNKCKIIDKETIQTLFPIIIELYSENDFQKYMPFPNKYQLIINLTSNLQVLSENIENEKLKLQKSENEIENYLNELFNKLKEWLLEKEEQLYNEILNLHLTLKTVDQEYERIKNKLENERLIKEIEESKLQKEIEKEKNQRILNAKQTNKGLYSYYWKHRRKSWDYSNKNLFLDFGTHIFEVIDDEFLRKISKEEFINKIKNWS